MRRASKGIVAALSAALALCAVVAAAQVPPAAAVRAVPSTAPAAVPSTAPAAVPPAAVPSLRVDIRMKGLHARGQVRGGIYKDPNLWTDNAGIVSICTVMVHAHEATCTFTVPRPGRYAAAFFHDEDGDRVLDKNFLGIPTEGYAFSRDAHAALSAPAFERAAFDVPLRAPVSATMRY